MKGRQTYSIKIAAPIKRVFDVITNPEFTPKWVVNVVHETRDYPLKVGTVFKDRLRNGDRVEMTVDMLKSPALLRLTDGEFHEKYRLHAVDKKSTLIHITEWEGEKTLVYGGLREKLIALKKFIEQNKKFIAQECKKTK